MMLTSRNWLATAMTVIAVVWIAALNFFPEYTFGLAGSIQLEQFAAALLTLALPVAFLGWSIDGRMRLAAPSVALADSADPVAPTAEKAAAVPAYDMLLAAISFLVGCYVTVLFPQVSEMIVRQTPGNLAVAGAAVVLILEALRRTSGLGITLVAIAFIGLALVGHLLPPEIAGRRVGIDRFTYFLVWDSSAILGLPSQIIATTVLAFVLFGALLFETGGGNFFTDLSLTLMGRFRGGPGKIAVLASSLFGSISGSVVANVATTGVVTIPMMKKAGFRPTTAGAIEAVASTGGQLLPPLMGIAAFLLAEFLQISYAEVALAALVPAILFYVAIFIQVDLYAARNNLHGLPRSELPAVGKVLRAGWFHVIPFAVLVLGLFVWHYPPESAAILATAAILVVTLIFGRGESRPTAGKLIATLRETGYSMVPMVLIGAAAGVVIATLNYTGMGFGLSLALVTLAGGNLLLLLVLVAIASIILGMGLPTVGVYVLLATLVAPALISLGVEPLSAHLFILYYGCLSMITPPVAIGAFAAANIAKAPPMATGWESMRLGWMIFVIPFLFVSSDTLLLRGPLLLDAMDFIAAVAGIWLVSSGFAGVMFGRIGTPLRALSIVAGSCLILPDRSIPFSREINLAGLVLAVAVVAIAVLLRQRGRNAEPAIQASSN